MGTYVICAVLAVIVIFAVKSGLSHFKGEGGCCGGGGGSIIVQKKLNGPVILKKSFIIKGMKCDNCRIRAQNALNEIEGVLAKVNLKKGRADISCDRKVDDEVIKAAVEKCGYSVSE
ncbi:heavy-metal-associated domain-containing protein [Treponema rectale]|uniref:Copper chaperone CopZ n=1 Tax=Treponema rectale TaxID=744512 RepID=A0A840SAC8_9SPIR|nr:heavy metal-associated domain-containing protein [Treponema rectale]MBB5217660.1 copper chaperone CopZ [Treponema rectale]QOS40606.1 heavy-metal-associated domain-containing protein [Treponema rectale]